jgi:flagellin
MAAPIGVQTNVSSINSQRYLSINSRNLSTTIARLSSGIRVNSAADDAAGIAISEGLHA